MNLLIKIRGDSLACLRSDVRVEQSTIDAGLSCARRRCWRESSVSEIRGQYSIELILRHAVGIIRQVDPTELQSPLSSAIASAKVERRRYPVYALPLVMRKDCIVSNVDEIHERVPRQPRTRTQSHTPSSNLLSHSHSLLPFNYHETLPTIPMLTNKTIACGQIHAERFMSTVTTLTMRRHNTAID